MDNSADCTVFFLQNTDITGIGVRLALYFQLVIFVIQANLKPEEALGALWALACLNCGLMVAAAALFAQDGLSFFNALLVQHLVCLTNTALVRVSLALWESEPPAPGKDSKGSRNPWKRWKGWKSKDKVSFLFWIVQCLFALALLITLWVSGEHFGPESSCISSMHFYIMFWRIPGSNPFRTAEIANLVIYIGLLLLPITHIPAFLAHHAHKLLLKALPSRRLEATATEHRDVEKGALATEKKHEHSRLAKCLEHSVGWCLAACFYIPSIELSLHETAHQSDSSSQWSFGQIFALIVVLPPLVALIFDFFDEEGPKEKECEIEADMPRRAQRPGMVERESSGDTLYPDPEDSNSDDKKFMDGASVIQMEVRQ